MPLLAPSSQRTGRTDITNRLRPPDVVRQSPLILVVEDDRTAGRLMEMLLTNAGFRTVLATNASQAWHSIRENRPDLILLDITFPGGNGFEICLQLKDDPGLAQTPVLFISADQDVASKVRGFEVGGVDYIPKPFSGPEVLARITTHLKLKQAYESIARLQAERIERLAGVQEMLMPQPDQYPSANFQVSIQQISSAGGDFYDVIPIGEHTFDYIVADASGHDLAASFWTASLKTLLSEYAGPANSPQNVLQSVNNAMSRILPAGTYFTAIYARLNRKIGKLTITNAGHPPAIICRYDDPRPVVVEQAGDVIGAFNDACFETVEYRLRPGDRFFLYSDGLVEFTGSRAAGIERLGLACATGDAVPLSELVTQAANPTGLAMAVTDDVVLLGIEV